jgi:predicted nucleotide-binding protein
MATRKGTSKPEQPKRNPSLVVSRSKAEEKIKVQIDKGNELKNRQFGAMPQLVEARSDKKKWKSYSSELLSRLFDDTSLSEKFDDSDRHGAYFIGDTSFADKVQDFKGDMQLCINNLESLYERLELIPELNPITVSSVHEPEIVSTSNIVKRKVFVVHGHDNGSKQSAARFIENMGLEAVIFHEQHDGGDTIIEKLERVSDVGYAIVLLTPDDMGHAKGNPEKSQSRARQNVIFEWGYFTPKLGRKNVFALLKDDVEFLSDMQGVLWTKMDDDEAWKFKLARELKVAGFEIDASRLLG